jgi:acyl-CoA thioesterase-2
MRSDVIPDTLAWDGSDVIELLDLAPLADGRLRSRFTERNEHGRIYGGQLLGQTLMAAARTVPADRSATYLQLLFAAGGIPEQAIDYEITVLQDTEQFTSRKVRGVQAGGRVVCDANVSFARLLDAPSHGGPAAGDSGLATDPYSLPGLKDIDAPEVRDIERTLDIIYRDHSLIDLRFPFIDDVLHGDSREPRVRFWIRLRSPIGDDPVLHASTFAYISDYWINFAVSIAHARPTAEAGGKLYIASLNHAIWFHAPLRTDGWLLFDSVSPRAALGRGLATARVYAQSGEMVASAAQECLLAPA